MASFVFENFDFEFFQIFKIFFGNFRFFIIVNFKIYYFLFKYLNFLKIFFDSNVSFIMIHHLNKLVVDVRVS